MMKLTTITAALAFTFAGSAIANDTVLDISEEHNMIEYGIDRMNIHKQLVSRARSECRRHGERGVSVRKWERECTAELLDKAVVALSDAQLAAIHEQNKQTNLAAYY